MRRWAICRWSSQTFYGLRSALDRSGEVASGGSRTVMTKLDVIGLDFTRLDLRVVFGLRSKYSRVARVDKGPASTRSSPAIWESFFHTLKTELDISAHRICRAWIRNFTFAVCHT